MKVRIQCTELRRRTLRALWHRRVLWTEPRNVFDPGRWQILEDLRPITDAKPVPRKTTFAERSFLMACLDAGLIERGERRFKRADWSPWIMVPTADGRALISAWDILEEPNR